MPKPRSPLPPTVLTLKEARAAVRRLLDGEPGASDADRHAAETVIREWEIVWGQYESFVDCPGCGAGVHKAHAAAHVPTCSRHPSTVRLRAVSDALRIAPEICLAMGFRPTPPDSELLVAADEATRTRAPARYAMAPSSWETTAALKRLLDRDLRSSDRTGAAKAVDALSLTLAEWERAYHRETDPCPLCDGVFDLEDFPFHLSVCECHPANAIATRGQAMLGDCLGPEGAHELLRLVTERNDYRGGLHALWRACESYVHDMGWSGECAYSDKYTEAPWRAARERGEKLVGFEPSPAYVKRKPGELAAGWPPLGAPVAAALARVVAAQRPPGEPVASSSDVELLRGCGAELLVLAQRYGDSVACPCCRRSGISIFEAAQHVNGCLLRPAMVRTRALESELRVLGAVARVRRHDFAPAPVPSNAGPQLRLLWPRHDAEEARLAPSSYGLKFLREKIEKVEFLLDSTRRAQYPTIIESYGSEVEEALDKWQRYRSASQSPCPACDVAFDLADLPSHVARCTSHLERLTSSRMEAELTQLRGPKPNSFSELRTEVDRWRIALATLLDECNVFWNRMGDGDDGKSLARAELWPPFDAARAEAKVLLDSSPHSQPTDSVSSTRPRRS